MILVLTHDFWNVNKHDLSKFNVRILVSADGWDSGKGSGVLSMYKLIKLLRGNTCKCTCIVA